MMLFFVFFWALALNWFAYKKGFYRIPKQQKKGLPQVSLFGLFVSFGLYFLISFILVGYFIYFIRTIIRYVSPEIQGIPLSVGTLLQALILGILFICLQLFFRYYDKKNYQKIWKNRDHLPCYPIESDLGFGVIGWILGFPVALLANHFLDFILNLLFKYQHVEQNAVQFVKAAAISPLALFFALCSVLVLAPLVEEFLFRGVLQTFFRKYLGVGASILLSAFIFACVHFSFRQGFDNISLILTLFVLGLYLGFIYERQGSLWAPISLHAVFNGMSALRILFLPEVAS